RRDGAVVDRPRPRQPLPGARRDRGSHAARARGTNRLLLVPAEYPRTATKIVRVSVVLAAGLALLVLVAGAVMFRSPDRLLSTNHIANAGIMGPVEGKHPTCQREETLPAGTSKIVLFLESIFGPKLTVEA